ncbi:DUF4190 domain-containing protein [Paenibacillus chitinolyticus]|uniref:DUF4190 domain-containing protein n=1 Tax=Paenibacillus chitinolyticus TaxID=79263 RepID=A0A410X1A2_9BACL|nr:DUF4190 domain-containing protein [Paenibacillus chitinolyticus]MCY9592470.1 DUF4190 domain-containing protein [Paenibacillus chitinolyticus]MCY9594927.1 DUF4190 domain-containing protein [Paenibacillus chitinolyticus]QAV20389.1 DUF4190 domain-containing protein [Paenibacillus chitinolyticus]
MTHHKNRKKQGRTREHSQKLDPAEANSSAGREHAGRSDREEYAGELAPGLAGRNVEDAGARSREDADSDAWISARALGIMALVSSVLSFFLLPFVLGPLGAILGYMALADGSRRAGGWAIAIGLISFFSNLFFVPFVI